MFVGYQAVGTTGRAIVDGASSIKLFGESIEVKAEIKVLAGISGHADREGLLAGIEYFSPKPQKVFISRR
jgi:metallo-beta-lactamase family protein